MTLKQLEDLLDELIMRVNILEKKVRQLESAAKV